ncbi:MAG: DUF4091 domain-containing protein, partial [Bacteroidaceae bacterium]|nr:DUF4091 domain-containing protein [Bacteroidaceae bacterium]
MSKCIIPNARHSIVNYNIINPISVISCYYTYPAGDAFLVYPREDGMPEESLRLKVFGHALQDQRAM